MLFCDGGWVCRFVYSMLSGFSKACAKVVFAMLFVTFPSSLLARVLSAVNRMLDIYEAI